MLKNDAKNRSQFAIKFGDDTTSYLAVSELEANEWIKAIKEFQTESKKSGDTKKDIESFLVK